MASGKLEIFDHPLCLVGCGIGSKLSANQEVLAQLQQLEKPVVVVAIAGLYRTGKSYLMNRLAGKSSGFELGSTIQSMTKGIWIWAREHPNNPDQYILLLDTEGLGDAEKGDQNHDVWIFCLATLLSSTHVYNSLSAINEDALAKLNFVTEMSKHIRIKENGKHEDEDNFDWYFPHFVFALRDFTLELEIKGEEVTADEYMEHCLTLKPSEKENEQCNLPRMCIRKYFKHRRCFTFDRPCGRKKLKILDNLDLSELSEDFRDEVDNFLEYIYSESPVKKLENGTEINGRMFSSLVGTYVDAIQNGALPCIENAVVAMATIENNRNVEEAIKLYEKEMNDRLNLPTTDDKTLADIHFKCFKQALDFFMTQVVCDGDNKFQKEINEKIEARFKQFVKENEAASKGKCRALLKELNKAIDKKMKKGAYAVSGGFTQFQYDVKILRNTYMDKKDLGVMSVQELLNFEKEKTKEGEGVLAVDISVTRHEKKVKEERLKAMDAEWSRRAAEREKQVIQDMAAERERAMKENLDRIEKQRQEDIKNLQRHHEEVMNSRLQEQRRLNQEGLSRESERLRREIDELKYKPPVVEDKKSGCVIQ